MATVRPSSSISRAADRASSPRSVWSPATKLRLGPQFGQATGWAW